ncbi:hypothetical protein [Microcoleus sp. EPA2]|uniref:hypothetical protein n=1 Tax=Microcoleus sp. EPA2 TaxID=2841654 RepID=UPI00312B3E27
MIDDSSLCQLIKQALQDSEGDRDLHNAVEVLALAIDQLPEVKAYLSQGWLPYYDEALPMTMRDVKRNINKFPQMYRLNMASVNCENPSDAGKVRKMFIHWVIMILRRDCYDVKRQRDKQPQIFSTSDIVKGEVFSLDNCVAMDQDITTMDRLIQQEQRSLAVKLKRYIEQDPEEKLKNSHPRGRADCNCQVLSQKILLDNFPSEIKSIARELNIPYQTLLTHWNRKCLPILVELAKNLGY